MTELQSDDIPNLETLATTLVRRLRILETQLIAYGSLAVPTHIVLEKEDTERQLQQVRADLRHLRSVPNNISSPYLGLLTFREEHASLFFGRDTLVMNLLKKVRETSFLTVSGPSGSGKSSVVRAGLVPMLKSGALRGSERWHYLTIKPGARPLNTLAAALAKTYSGTLGDVKHIRDSLRSGSDALILAADMLLAGQDDMRLVVIIDQFEELWTLAPTTSDARASFLVEQQRPFVDILLGGLDAPDSPLLVLPIIRADFLHRAAENAQLVRALNDHLVVVGPPIEHELRSIIVRPAEIAECTFESGLVEELIEQTVNRQGALPLLEFALLELWNARSVDDMMTWEAFRAIGGVEGGVGRRADAILSEQYTLEEQSDLRAILLRLVQPGEGTIDTRRRIPLHDLVSVGSSVEAVQARLKPLVDARLITIGQDLSSGVVTVEVTHEALIRAWPTLSAWLDKMRDDLRFQIQLEEAAKDWIANNEGIDFLWSGLRLANALAWAEGSPFPLIERDQRFLNASHAVTQARIVAEEQAHQREIEQVRALTEAERQKTFIQVTTAQRLRRRALILAVALSVSVIALIFAIVAIQRANHAADLALARQLIAEAQITAPHYPLLALRLAIESIRIVPIDEKSVQSELLTTTVQLARQGRLQELATEGADLYSAPTNSLFVLARNDMPGKIYRLNEDTVITLPDKVVHATFNPNSNYFALSYKDKPGELRSIVSNEVITLTDKVTNATFSPNGQFLVVTYENKAGELRRTDNNTIITLSGQVVLEPVFSPNGETFVIMYKGKPRELRYTDNNRIVRLSENLSFDRVLFSPDGKTFIMNNGIKPSELRYVNSNTIVTLTDRVMESIFSHDSKAYIVTYLDRPSELRYSDDATVITLSGQVESYQSTVFSPDNKILFLQYRDKPGELRRIDGSLIVGLITNVVPSSILASSPDNKVYVVAYPDRPGELRRTDNNIVVTLTDKVTYTVFGSDSKTFVVAYEHSPGELRRTDTDTIVRLSQQVTHGGIIFSPNGKAFIVNYAGSPAELRHTDDNIVIKLSARLLFDGVVFSPDSKLAVLSYEEPASELRNIENNTVVMLPGHVTINRVVFSSDSNLLWLSYFDRPDELWDTDITSQQLTNLGLGVTRVVFATDAQRVVVEYTIGQMYLLDIASLRALSKLGPILTESDLLKYACNEPLTSSLWTAEDQKELSQQLNGRAPRACQLDRN
jgi:WD40 repeat protein